MLFTDHEPLLTIFSPNRGIPIFTTIRLERSANSCLDHRCHIILLQKKIVSLLNYKQDTI